MKKVLDWVAMHPIISMFGCWFFLCLAIGLTTGGTNFGWYWILTLCLFWVAAPFLRNRRNRIKAEEDALFDAAVRKAELDYLAKRIAYEQGKKQKFED